jgi:hypothetical protein
MHEATGNLWEYPAQYRVITTNGVVTSRGLVMGRGSAGEAKLIYPDLPHILGRWITQYGNRAFIYQPYRLITFPTKNHWQHSSIIELILQSAAQVVDIADKYRITSIVMPRPGCGNGGLNWREVKPKISKILDDRFIAIHR